MAGYSGGGYVSGGGTVIKQLYVTVPISGALIGDEDFIAQKVTRAVQVGVSNGTVDAGWND
jgi:hypothetical protein